MPSKKNILRTFRISPFHNMILNQPPYYNHAGLLVRILLDEFFASKLPEVELKFKVQSK